jgi:cytochrome c1
VITAIGCGACHVIPGIPNAVGLVGPPLAQLGQRAVIGGELANTPENLERWIMDAPSINPRTDMPDLGLNRRDAGDIAAYLYTLR